MQRLALLAMLVIACGDDAPGEPLDKPTEEVAEPARPPAPPPLAPTPRPKTPTARAYLDGGTPLFDEDVQFALSSALEELAAAKVDRVSLERLRRTFDAYPTVRPAWLALIDALARRPRDQTWGLGGQIRNVNSALQRVGLAFYLDSHMVEDGGGRMRVVLDTYRVSHVGFRTAGTTRHPVMELVALNATQQDPLGSQLDTTALLFRDNVHFIVTRTWLPVLFDNVDATFAGWPLGAELSRAMSAAQRRDMAAWLASDSAELREACVDVIADMVARHEVQHLVDTSGANPLRSPKQLLAIADETGAWIVQFELSAYVSQIANEPITPHFAYGMVLHNSLYDNPTLEAPYVAALVTEGLARRLGIAVDAPTFHDDKLDRDRLARLAIPILKHSGAELRAAAAEVYRDLFGVPVPAITP